MSEYVCHAVIRNFREFKHYENDQLEQRWSYRKPVLRSEFSVGVLGAGVLGSKVAQALQQFEFPVNVWSRSPKHLAGVKSFTGPEQLPAFLKATRVLVNLLPPHTRHRKHFEPCQFVATSSGFFFNQCSARQAFGRSRFAKFIRPRPHGWRHTRCVRVEPLPQDHAFWKHPKVVVTPHTSARTLREESVAQIASKIQAVYAGQPIEGRVDKVRGY